MSAVPASAASAPVQERLLLRLAVEEFLAEEAALLDGWRLDEWLALFTEDAHYVVPATDRPEADPQQALMLIDDNLMRLKARVGRLKSRYAHREYPYSRTRRIMSGIRITRSAGNEVDVEASFAVYRVRDEITAPYVGLYRYTLVRGKAGEFRIRLRRAQLDLERLSEHGAVSIIL